MTFFILTIISAVILFGFIIFGCMKYGLLPSYSDYSTKWLEDQPKFSMWTLFTVIAALLIIPPLIEVGTGSVLQFLGFMAPVYLIVVAFTPRWDSNRKEHVIHNIFAALCSICGILWCALVANSLPGLLLTGFITLVGAISTETLNKGLQFYLELIVFMAIYGSLLAWFNPFMI